MDALLRLVFDNFFLLVAFAVAWNVVGIGYRLWKRKGKGLVFPKPTDPGVVYSERFASGSSHKSWRTRLGGASNCLTVIVTESPFPSGSISRRIPAVGAANQTRG